MIVYTPRKNPFPIPLLCNDTLTTQSSLTGWGGGGLWGREKLLSKEKFIPPISWAKPLKNCNSAGLQNPLVTVYLTLQLNLRTAHRIQHWLSNHISFLICSDRRFLDSHDLALGCAKRVRMCIRIMLTMSARATSNRVGFACLLSNHPK